jgi:ketosteroid isomerase-like protein
MTMTVREAFEKHTEAFNSHDIDGFAGALADDVVFRAPGGMAGERKPAFIQFFGGWLDAFPDAHVEIHDLHITGDVAVHEGTFTGTHHGGLHAPAGEVRATGRPITLDYIEVLHHRDGKQVSVNLMYDQLLLLEQLGLIPAQQPAG